MKQIIEDGEIGQPSTFEATLLQPRFPVDSDRLWLSREDAASGALFVASAHLIDTITHVLGGIVALSARIATLRPFDNFHDTGHPFVWTATDTVMMLAELETGLIGVAHVSNVSDPPTGLRFRVNGDEGQVMASAAGYPQFSPIRLSISKNGERFVEVSADRADSPHRLLPEDPAANVASALSAFARSSTAGNRFRPDFADGLALHLVLDAVTESSQSRTWQYLAETSTSGESVRPLSKEGP